MAERKTILLIDDHPMFREGLKVILRREPGYRVLAEAGTGEQGVEMAGRLSPDMVLLDISLPDASGLRIIGELKKLPAQPKVIIVSMHGNVDYVVEAFHAGAIGYVTKESAGEQLLMAMEAAFRGEYYLDGSASQDVLRKLMDFAKGKSRYSDAEYGALTNREQEILRLVAQGLSTREIGEKLFISHKTVENHRARIMRKLGLHNAVDMARYAAKMGLIDLDNW